MINTKSILISVIVLGVASLSLISEDFSKFLLSGQSNTYSISLVRHSSVVVFAISLVVIFFIFFFKKNNVCKWLLGISIVVWVLSQRTYAIVKSQDTILISGFAVIPVNRCKLSSKGNCDVKFDFFLAKEVEKAIKADMQNR